MKQEDHINDIKNANEIIRLNAILEECKLKYKTINFDQKTIVKIKNQFMHFSETAHYVLTQYKAPRRFYLLLLKNLVN